MKIPRLFLITLVSLSAALAQQPIQNVRTVPTLAALKNIPVVSANDGTMVEMAGYSAANDGGGGTFIYSSASSETANTSIVVAPNSGSGRWIRVMQDAINVRWFGATGDGSTNDSTAIQAALDYGKPIHDDGRTTYRVGTALLYSRTDSRNHLIIKGKLRLRPDDNVTCLSIQGGVGAGALASATTYLTVATRVGRESITVNSVTGMQAGDIIIIRNTASVWPYGATTYPTFNPGETNRIKSISGTTITLAEPNYLNYPSGATTTVTAYRPTKVDIEGLEIEYASTSTSGGFGMYLCADSEVRGLVLKGPKENAASVGSSHGLLFTGCRISDASEAGLGYGIQFVGCTTVTVANSYLTRNRHGVDFSGAWPTHNGTVVGCTVIGERTTGSALGSHGTANKCNFIGNTISGAIIGIGLRSPNNVVLSNTFYNVATCVYVDGAGGLVVANNASLLYNASTDGADNGPSYLVEVKSTEGENNDLYYIGNSAPFVVENNHGTFTRALVFFSTTVTNIKGWRVCNNTIRVVSNSGGNPTAFIAADVATVADLNCQFFGNSIRNISGSFTKFENVTLAASITDWEPATNCGVTLARVSGGTLGAPTYNYSMFKRDPTGRMIRLQMSVTFTISGGDTLIAVQGTGIGNLKSQTRFYSRETGAANCIVGFVASNSDNLYVGNSTTDPTDDWPNGTYTVEFDIEFEYRYNQSY